MNEMRQNIIRVITAHKLQRKSALTITVTGFKISGNTSEGDEQLLTTRTEKLCCHIYIYKLYIYYYYCQFNLSACIDKTLLGM